jgi:hypothetical protein
MLDLGFYVWAASGTLRAGTLLSIRAGVSDTRFTRTTRGDLFPLKGLIIDSPHIDHILAGRKRWEMRPAATQQRGTIALIRKGTDAIVATADLVDSLGPLTDYELRGAQALHRIPPDRLRSPAAIRCNHAWILENVRSLPAPIAYRRSPGAVVWVTLENEIADVLCAVPMA